MKNPIALGVGNAPRTAAVFTRSVRTAAAFGLLALLAACGDAGNTAATTAPASTTAPSTYTVGGMLSGLSGSLSLQNNAGDDLILSANGSFTMPTVMADASSYNISVLSQPGGQTCSIGNAAGTVSGSNISNVAVTCSANSYPVGGAVSGLTGTLVLQNNSGDDLTLSANGSYGFATAVATGSTYAVTALSQPAGQSCSITNGTGSIGSAAVNNVLVSCATNMHTVSGTITGLKGNLVVQNNADDDFSTAVNGAFSFATTLPFGSSYAVTKLSQQFPNQTCTVSNGSGTIAGNVSNVAIDCAAHTVPKYAYVANNDDTVSQYTIGTDGSLTPMSPATIAVSYGSSKIAAHPNGRFVYVTKYSDNLVLQFAVGIDGRLSPMSPASVATGSGPSAIIIDPTGRYIYTSNFAGENQSLFSIGTDGALTPMSTPSAAEGIASVAGMVFDLNGQYAYLAGYRESAIFQYTVGTDGALASMSPASFVTGSAPLFAAADPNGRAVYVINLFDNSISQYAIGSNGSLTPMSTATVATGDFPISIAVDPSGRYAYVVGLSPTAISQFTIGSDGSLTSTGSVSVPGVYSPSGITVDPSGSHVYVADQNNYFVHQYTIGTDGSLTPKSPASVANGSGSAAIVVVGGP